MWSTPRMRNVTTTFFIRCQCNMIISILLFVNLLSLFCFNKQQEFNKEITYIALLLVQVVQFQFQYLLSLIHICTNTIHWHPQRLNILRHHQNISWKSSEGVSTFMIKKEKNRILEPNRSLDWYRACYRYIWYHYVQRWIAARGIEGLEESILLISIW